MMALLDLSAQPGEHTVLQLREFCRRLVRELGFMRTTVADSDLAPSAAHAIIEIGTAPGIQARDLASVLRLDKSNTNGQVARLESLGLVARAAAGNDGRSTRLYLTDAGRRVRNKIDRFATDQVSNALRRLAPAEQHTLVRSIALYADALAQHNASKPQTNTDNPDPQIREGYRPGCIGDVASLHARFYAAECGFDMFFEHKVATELAGFAQSLPAPDKALWLYMENGRSLASLAIDGDSAGGSAHLRWFIVDESLRGLGIGRRLLARALDFVDARFSETYLWTFKGLDAARHLYESAGFTLTAEAEGAQWGTTVIEQRYSRRSNRMSAPPT
jgi:DNA-binding MarR family transcriptional regulator/GNAT superfamily N-acetyltransferase